MKTEEIIGQVVQGIAEACNPVKIILVSNKFSIRRELTSFKLCIIVQDVPSTAELEGELYMKTDSPVPFDILIYNLSQWEELVTDEDTFAAKVERTGVVLYGEN